MKRLLFALLLIPALSQANAKNEAFAFEQASDLLFCSVSLGHFSAYASQNLAEESMSIALGHSYEMAATIYLDFADASKWPSIDQIKDKFRSDVKELTPSEFRKVAIKCTGENNLKAIELLRDVIGQNQ